MNFKSWLLSLIFVLTSWNSSVFAAEEVGQFASGARKQGLYSALELGGLFMLGLDREFSNGWVVGVKAGYDVFRTFGFEGFLRFSGHESNNLTVTSGVTPTFFAYQVGGLFKGAYPITRRLFVGAGVGGGAFITHPNSKPTRTSATHGMFTAEVSAEYFMRTRGISLGLNPSISGIQNHKSAVLQASSYLRYSF
jgi:hypothetical protein